MTISIGLKTLNRCDYYRSYLCSLYSYLIWNTTVKQYQKWLKDLELNIGISELIEIEETSKFTSHKAIEKLEEIGRLIARHEVEEEARIIQVITEKVKEPERLVKVIQEHRSIIDLLEKKISQLEDSSQEVVVEIKTLCNDMRKHFSEEEEIVFPLMLKAISK